MRTLEPGDFEVALQIMKQYGWHKGAALGPGGAVCAARALNLAARQRSGDWCDLDEARKWLDVPGTAADAIPRWNDRNSTTFRDVIHRFRMAGMRMHNAETTFVGTEAAAARIEQLKERRQ